MKWAKNALSSSFYINSPPPCEGNPSPNPLHFSICLFFAFKLHTHCVSMVYGDFILHFAFTLPSHLISPPCEGGQGDVPSVGPLLDNHSNGTSP